jgi:hypothetical protein
VKLPVHRAESFPIKKTQFHEPKANQPKIYERSE